MRWVCAALLCVAAAAGAQTVVQGAAQGSSAPPSTPTAAPVATPATPAAPVASGTGLPQVVRLDDASSLFADAALGARQWTDPDGKATFEQVLAGRVAWRPWQESDIHRLGSGGALWLHLRVQRPAGARQAWLLEVPLPLIDEVTLWQRDPAGRWQAQSAGDTVAVGAWPQPGRYPFFHLDVPPGETRDLYVRIHHVTSVSVPVCIVSGAVHDRTAQVQYLLLGSVFGGLMLMIVACLVQAYVYRDRAYAWYAAYAMVTALAVAAYTGVAAHLLWPFSGWWADTSQGLLAILAGNSALFFVRDLGGIAARLRLFDRLVVTVAMAGFLLAMAYPFVPREVGVNIVGGYPTLVCVLASLVALIAWRRGEPTAPWIMAAYVPLAMAVALVLLRIFGHVPANWATQYFIVVALALQVPLLLMALNIRSRERHGTLIRELALTTQDALTGLLAPLIFQDRLRQAIGRYRRDREDAAVVYIDLVNHERIRTVHGQTVAEQSLLRSVIKLRRVVRDVDTVARVGEARFGLILEGVSARAAVTDRMARLIAAGLMPLKGLQPEVTLQFHAAAVILSERLIDAPEMDQALSDLLASMSPRTRRPIRFMEPEITHPMPLEPDSRLPEDEQDSSLPRRAADPG